jgi:hypothetical protein
VRLPPLLIGAQHLGLPRKHTTIPCGCSAGANTVMLAGMKHEDEVREVLLTGDR